MYKGKKIIHIVACSPKGVIGKDNKMIWHVPEDFKFFREKTLGNVVLMGRKTVESLPAQLPRRIVITVSRDGEEVEGENLEKALDKAVKRSNLLGTDEIYIAGGGEIYNATEDIVDEVYCTFILRADAFEIEGDTHYKIGKGFHVEWVEPYKLTKSTEYLYSFRHLKRG